MPLDYKIIGKNIKNRRKDKHVTQQKMADDLYLSLSLISKLERGVKAVSLDTFQAIAEYLDADISMLLADPDNPLVQHDQMIQDIGIMLEDMDNRHLHIVNQVLKTYYTQIRQLQCDDPASDQQPHPVSGQPLEEDAVSDQQPEEDTASKQRSEGGLASGQRSAGCLASGSLLDSDVQK